MGHIYQRKKNGKVLPIYWISYTDHNGSNIRRSTKSRDERVARKYLSDAESLVEARRLGVPVHYAEESRKPLREHLEEYRAFLKSKGGSARHVRHTAREIERCQLFSRWAFPGDMKQRDLVNYLNIQRDKGWSARSSNFALGAVRGFAKWMVRSKRLAENPFDDMRMLNTREDRRYERRPLTNEEFSRLLEAAGRGKKVEGISGPDRVILYILAAWTGYRRGELGSVCKRSFDWKANALTVKAGYSKRKRDDRIPLHPVVAERVKEWLETKRIPETKPLLPVGQRKTAKMMRVDLEAAGIPYVDEDGRVADFHSNRHTFISNLARAGVSPKTAQALARHSDINLTMGIYTHIGRYDEAAAVEKLPAPPSLEQKKVG